MISMLSNDTRGVVAPALPGAGRLRPLGIDEVTITDGFWAQRQRVNATATIDHCDAWEQRVGWIDNFAAAAEGTVARTRTGREFSDSDVYKLVEAMAWEVARTGDPRLDARVEELAQMFERVQEPDGYLSTRYGRPGQEPRYSDLAWGHELYCYGHLIQAAVARLRSGRQDTLVRVALRAADHVCEAFGPDGIASVCGHPEIEVALVELYRATGERRYLDQARLFVERRGTGTLPDIEFGRAYYQDDVPVRDADVLRGHAVRALYLTAGVVDLAVETGDDDLLEVARRQYARTLARRTYLTGGMGSHHQDEAYGDDFELPPDRSYCETCAGVASVMVAWRLSLATGDLAWGDVVERTLYNVVATSPAADGRSFFYTNPLHKRVPGQEADADQVSPRALSRLRAPWFEVSCCPTNVARTFASLAGYVASADEQGVQLHQLVPCTVTTRVAGGDVRLEVATRYPEDGDVVVRVLEAPDGPWELSLRVPAWARGAATLDGVPVDGGVARVAGLRAGSTVRLALPVTVRVTLPDERVDAVRGSVAFERGPVVLCLESSDLPDGLQVDDVELVPGSPVQDRGPGARVRLRRVEHDERAWPYAASAAGAAAVPGSDERALASRGADVEADLVPYNTWANRGPSTMRIWVPAG
ncbi:glycoside hydrolase family 127 protein [Cellulomonas sp. DKR-3]|uniref:Glycoside hydrolase family 127 protein n=1 Tax=Cellulomonas fulva TaxID=2835530 RepID=A0ABS5TYH8_9CELL|nr:beta-L-arabinofuranosidase domain-containing protein [Cellulomonas fulva]MBT0994186.1 glycoside hydrolase family 127 protein [Cellulomonas fulva]